MTDDEFCALYDEHARRLWAFVRRLTRNPAAADDIVQEAFIRVYQAAALRNASEDHRRRYLYTVATNLVRRHGREEQRYGDLGTEPASRGPEIGDQLSVQRVLETLPMVERQALWLTYVERWSSRDLAAMLGYREGSMRQVITRARRRFTEMFGADAGTK